MKKIGLTLCFIFFTLPIFGQQFLWTTVEDTKAKYVKLKNVIDEVLVFYDQNKYYYNLPGLDKETFIEMIVGSIGVEGDSYFLENFKENIHKIKDPIVFASRIGLEPEPIILVFCICKENVSMIGFSNISEQDAIVTSPENRKPFSKWFKRLLK